MAVDECDFCQRLGAYYDGELDAAARAEVERHLRACGVCTDRLAQLRGMSDMFAAAPVPRLSQISMHRLHTNLDLLLDRGLLRLARVLSAVAASVLLFGSTWLVMNSATRSGPAVSSPQASSSVVQMALQTEEQVSSAEPGPNDWIVNELAR
jgi:anti-sigma factor RsiW